MSLVVGPAAGCAGLWLDHQRRHPHNFETNASLVLVRVWGGGGAAVWPCFPKAIPSVDRQRVEHAPQSADARTVNRHVCRQQHVRAPVTSEWAAFRKAVFRTQRTTGSTKQLKKVYPRYNNDGSRAGPRCNSRPVLSSQSAGCFKSFGHAPAAAARLSCLSCTMGRLLLIRVQDFFRDHETGTRGFMDRERCPMLRMPPWGLQANGTIDA